MDVDLARLDCGGATPDLTKVHSFYIFLGNGGPDPIYIDTRAGDAPTSRAASSLRLRDGHRQLAPGELQRRRRDHAAEL